VINVWLRVVLESTNGLDIKSTTRALAQLRIWSVFFGSSFPVLFSKKFS
jgi:hypothetical protein